MLQAELNNKLNIVDFSDLKEPEQNLMGNDPGYENIYMKDIARKEDVLTSNVFGVIKNVDKKVVNDILEVSGITNGIENNAEFIFWEQYEDGTEPDLVIKDDKTYIAVEVKYLSDFHKGSSKKTPQILREIKGAQEKGQNRKIFFLAVTNKETIVWHEKVAKEYQEDIKAYEDQKLLHHISWDKIKKILDKWSCDDLEIDEISRYFLKDLVEYLNLKEIGGEVPPNGSRDMEYFFGEEIRPVETMLKKHGYKVCLENIAKEEKIELYDAVARYITMVEKDLCPINNSVDTEKVPISLFFDVDEEEAEVWTKFITNLYFNKFVNMTGKSNISAKLRFKKGNYKQKEVSLFTYRRGGRELIFQKKR